METSYGFFESVLINGLGEVVGWLIIGVLGAGVVAVLRWLFGIRLSGWLARWIKGAVDWSYEIGRSKREEQKVLDLIQAGKLTEANTAMTDLLIDAILDKAENMGAYTNRWADALECLLRAGALNNKLYEQLYKFIQHTARVPFVNRADANRRWRAVKGMAKDVRSALVSIPQT